jgi:hypothetical protein
MRKLEDIERKALQDPDVLLGFMSAVKGTTVRTEQLRTLFAHAGKAVPKDLQTTQAQTVEISRGELASLVYRSAKNHKCGPFSSARLWLKTRIG